MQQDEFLTDLADVCDQEAFRREVEAKQADAPAGQQVLFPTTDDDPGRFLGPPGKRGSR